MMPEGLLRSQKDLTQLSTPSPPGLFHITVGSVAKSKDDLESDLRMLRSALLYGHRVKVCSFTMSTLYTMFGYAGSIEGCLDLLERVARLTRDEAKRAMYLEKLEYGRSLLHKSRRDKRDLLNLEEIRRKAAQVQKMLKEQYPALAQESELKAIQRAVKSNILELHTFESFQFEALADKYADWKYTPPDKDRDLDDELANSEFVKLLSAVVENHATFPLFDDTTGNLVKKGIEDGAMSASEVRVAQARHSTTAAAHMERIPDFGSQPIDKILDFREELHPSLESYRASILSYAEKIKSAPWSKDFAPEANAVFRKDVLPALMALEDSMKLNSHIKKELKDVKYMATGAGASTLLSYFVDDSEALPIYTRLAFGLAVPTGISVIQGIANWLHARQENKKHSLYFYYRLRKMVKK